ncbi:uncharacterized protein TRAVEDRAFT_24514 [Trametes versicolor FP-101664 SS1]|uniref:uncharacterized protein n=1 Tax=Trametes versicolor (strain FP-101664) TaxID=717944 RepID=UPI00046230F0|nr:uncharacterized protein TRAVEDRAFT_24514 [Trametes versicolor FP-101664 SS1]EIW52232.1 hypothetical protein TRAVEDRAFT_24514 [Trametes versicolor FP-101664 SS1]
MPPRGLSIVTLQSMNDEDKAKKARDTPRKPGSRASSSTTTPSTLSASAVLSVHAPDDYERTSYYNGISASDHPDLIYRSDYLTRPFPKPAGGHADLPVKSIHGTHGTPLKDVWDVVAPQVFALLKAGEIKWTSLSTVCFFTDTPGEDEGTWGLGPPVIWVKVPPGSTSADAAHEVSQEILAVLKTHDIDDVVVEWCEAEGARF